MYTSTNGSRFDILEYLGCGEFLIEVLSHKSGCYRCQISKRDIRDFDFDNFCKRHNINENERVIIKKTTSETIKLRKKRKRKNG